MSGEAIELQIGRRSVRLPNPDKMMFPDAGVTKADLVAYYRDVSDLVLPHLGTAPWGVTNTDAPNVRNDGSEGVKSPGPGSDPISVESRHRYPAPSMLRSPTGFVTFVVVAGLTLAGCASASGDQAGGSDGSATSTTVSSLPTTTTTTAPTRVVEEQAWTPFATVGGITLHHPSQRVERVGFHQSNHEGARDLEPRPSAVAPVVLEDRERLTGPRSAADIVVDPDVEIRSPVTGTVKRAGTYVLYCEHSDDYAVVAPDANPAWEVKLLHIDGVSVRAGERVVAGETVIAGGPTQLPFESQVDELAPVPPAWPHVHLEVVDPSIPNIPSPGGGC